MDEDEDDEYEELDDAAVANFRSRMGNIFGTENSSSEAGDESSSSTMEDTEGTGEASIDELINFARMTSKSALEEPKEWVEPVDPDDLDEGIVLLANPEKFCSDFGGKYYRPNRALLAKFGLTQPPPADLGADRRADLLPVLVLVEFDPKSSSRAVLLNRRTGYLLGDLEQPPAGGGGGLSSQGASPLLEKFCIQPLWFGGVDNASSGLDMLHLCPTVIGAKRLTEDGMYWGGDPSQAQEAMEDPSLNRVMTGFDFKFFVQSNLWSHKELQKEIKDGTWIAARVSKEVLFKSRDRMGTRRAKPLWTEIMEIMGGDKLEVRDKLYEDEE